MKTLKIIGVLAVAVVFMSGAGFAFEDEDYIVKRHEKRIEKIMVNVRSQGAISNAKKIKTPSDKKEGSYSIVLSGGFTGQGSEIIGEYRKKGNELWIREGRILSGLYKTPPPPGFEGLERFFGEWHRVDGVKKIEEYLASIIEKYPSGKTKPMPDAYFLCSIALNGEVFFPAKGSGEIGRIKHGDVRKQETPSVTAAKADLCKRLGIDEKMIKDFNYVDTGSWATASIPAIVVTNCKIGLVYKNETYIYEGHEVSSDTGVISVRAEFTGEIIPTEYDEKGNLILNASELKKKDKHSIDKTVRENYGFVVDDLAKFLNAYADKIKVIGMDGITSMDFANKYNGSAIELAYGIYNYLEISSKYQGEVYEYGVKVYHYPGAKLGEAQAILDPAHTGGEMHSVSGKVPGATYYSVEQIELPGSVLARLNDGVSIESIEAILGKAGAVIEKQFTSINVIELRFDPSKYTNEKMIDFLMKTGKFEYVEPNYLDRATTSAYQEKSVQLGEGKEIDQRKTVEAQIELRGNGKNYTISPQMADAPKEAIPLQKKQ